MCNKVLYIYHNQCLSETDWSPLKHYSDVDECYEHFLQMFSHSLDECCPLQSIRIKKRTNKPWFTKGIVNACRKKNSLYKAWLVKKDKCSEQRYKAYRNKLTSILRKAERAYYKSKLDQYKGDVKRTWIVINDVIRRGRKAKKLADFLCNAAACLLCITIETNKARKNLAKKLFEIYLSIILCSLLWHLHVQSCIM